MSAKNDSSHPLLIQQLTGQMGSRGGWPGRIGMDLVQISRIAQSLERFGARFEERLFAPAELEYARSAAGQRSERLAARFAAKEAAIKALGLSHEGVNWRELEVVRLDDGSCILQLHGRAAEVAARNRITQVLLSLTHDGAYAAAVVAALSDTAEPSGCAESAS